MIGPSGLIDSPQSTQFMCVVAQQLPHKNLPNSCNKNSAGLPLWSRKFFPSASPSIFCILMKWRQTNEQCNLQKEMRFLQTQTNKREINFWLIWKWNRTTGQPTEAFLHLYLTILFLFLFVLLLFFIFISESSTVFVSDLRITWYSFFESANVARKV